MYKANVINDVNKYLQRSRGSAQTDKQLLGFTNFDDFSIKNI